MSASCSWLLRQNAAHVVGHHSLQQARLNHLARSGRVADNQRSENALYSRMRGDVSTDLHIGVHRPLTAQLARKGHHTAGLRSDHALVAAIASEWPSGSEPGDGAVDQSRVQRAQGLRIGAKSPSIARPERDDDNVRFRRERVQPTLTSNRFEVEFHTAFAAQPHRCRNLVAERVTSRRLDLQDVSAKIRQDHRSDTAGRSCREIKNAKIGAGFGHRHSPTFPEAGLHQHGSSVAPLYFTSSNEGPSNAYEPRRCGSRTSRNPSPNILTPNTTSASAVAGAMSIHGAAYMYARPSAATMPPHDGVGGGTP